MGSHSVVASGLSKVYERDGHQIHALRDVDLRVDAGDLVIIRGKSGSGKTTLLHLLAGLLEPTAGQISIGGTDLHTLNEREAARFRRRHLGIVYQFFNLVPTLDVVHNVALPLLLDGSRLHEVSPRVRALLDRLEIGHRSRHRPSALSGGEMQRAAVARALIADPWLVLADEPTGNLDEESGARVLGLLRDLARERGSTTLVMTHDPNAAVYADRVIELRDGRIVDDTGTLEAPP
jgi:ABC-type lipoprotein export system ATPase subunit